MRRSQGFIVFLLPFPHGYFPTKAPTSPETIHGIHPFTYLSQAVVRSHATSVLFLISWKLNGLAVCDALLECLQYFHFSPPVFSVNDFLKESIINSTQCVVFILVPLCQTRFSFEIYVCKIEKCMIAKTFSEIISSKILVK